MQTRCEDNFMKFWVAVCSFVPAIALMFMDQTILPVALPAIQSELGATATQAQWCVNAYVVAIAMFLLVSGKLGDSLGLRETFSIGIVGFVITSICCGLSQSANWLIWMRGLQGVSAALMMPPQNAMMRYVFPKKSLGKGIGLIVSIGSIFLMIAPVIGGYLTENLSWRWIFWINAPIGAMGLWMVLALWPKSNPVKNPIDLWGFLYFALGVGLFTVFFMQVGEWGWGAPLSLSCLGLACIFLLLLLLREKQVSHPFLDLSLFKRPLFAAINISVSTAQAFLMVGVFWLLYFQNTLQYTPVEAGLLSFISGSPLLFASPLAGFLSDRFGPKLPVSLGYLFLIYTCVFFGFFPTPSLLGLSIALFIFGMGIPMILTPSFASALTSVPTNKVGIAMGTIITLRMVAGSIGLACMYLLTSSVYTQKLSFLGERGANITSFSTLHLTLGFFVMISFGLTFFLHTRKSAKQVPDYPGEGWG